METTMSELKKKCIRNAGAYNKLLSKNKLRKSSWRVILANVHPLDRGDYMLELVRIDREERKKRESCEE